MNILVFSWRDPKHPLAGGAEQVVYEHMKGWVENGHNVTHFSSFFPGAKQEESIGGINFVRQGYQLLDVQMRGFLWYLFGRHPKFDLVIDEFHGIPFFTPLYVKAKKLAILQEVAGKVWLKNDLPVPFNYIIGIIGYLFEPFIFLFYRSAPFIVGSNSAKDDLVKLGIPNKNINVIHHGVIIEPHKKFKKESINTIVYLGALAKDKGIEDAIKCFGHLNNKDKFQFWIIGKGGDDYVRELKNMTEKLGISENLKFWGFVSQKEKFELLERSHVLVNPSVLEGWGLVNIEANCCGLPVVAYKSQGLVDSVKNNESGIIVTSNNPETLAESIFKLMQDKIFYNKLSKGAKEWADNFRWDISKKKSLELIEGI